MDPSLIDAWKREETPFEGWDFSHIRDRLIEEKPPWSYEELARDLMSGSASVLDLGTGGGERLARLKDTFPARIAATEGYAPNLALAKKLLEPLGVEVVEAEEGKGLPFPAETFDRVLDRHTAFDAAEVARVLRPGGVFLTQQVSPDNLEDLATEFRTKPELSGETLEDLEAKLRAVGLEITDAQPWVGATLVTDIGALVFYLHAIPWQVPGFSLKRYQPELERLQDRLERDGKLVFHNGRLLLRAKKPGIGNARESL